MRIRVLCRVVSYRNSTSNHNFSAPGIASFLVVSYRNSTSNHNIYVVRSLIAPLYLIEILHQTTTTTTPASRCASCILSKFYIKPQLGDGAGRPAPRCILSKFYIKPQLGRQRSDFCGVVSYRNSTSNHNPTLRCRKEGALYLIEILHQTTTTERPEITTPGLYLIEILHQTTTFLLALFASMRCILSKFYIKPQQGAAYTGFSTVVSYRNSTSNHNNSSSQMAMIRLYLIEILHQTTTTQARTIQSSWLYLIEILHQTTTQAMLCSNSARLYLIEILHQTTTFLQIRQS